MGIARRYAGRDRASAEGRRVDQTALGPLRVKAPAKLQRRGCAEIAIEDLAVIAPRLDGTKRKSAVETEAVTEIPVRAEQAADFRVGIVLCLRPGILGRDAQLLGRDRKQIYRWLKRYQIDPDEYREG